MCFSEDDGNPHRLIRTKFNGDKFMTHCDKIIESP